MKAAISLIVSTLLISIASDSSGATLVVHEEYANKEGEGGQLLPTFSPARSQQVYSASRFTGLIPEGGYINAMTLRMDGERESAYKGSFPDVEIKMGVSPSLDPISTLEFSVNIGDRYLTVYGPKALEFNIPASNDPIKPFSFLIKMDQPFLYDPREGGLVVDFFFNRGSPDAGLLVDTEGRDNGIFGNIGSEQGRGSGAFVAEFMLIPIPEPSPVAIILLAVGLAVWSGGVRLRSDLTFPAQLAARGGVSLLLLLCFGLTHPNSGAATLVVPEEYSTKPGEGGQLLPTFSPERKQQVYSASRFIDLIPEGGYITQMSLRMDEARGSAYSGSFRNVEIKMGVSPSVDPISTLKFSINIGNRYITAYGPKALEFDIPASNDPIKPFSFLIRLDEPFLYDPREGGLVVDYFFYEGSPDAGLLIDTGGDMGIFGNIAGEEGRITRSFIAEFNIIPIPEPSTAFIALVGGGIMIGTVLWRKSA